jgi:hypothetical protein
MPRNYHTTAKVSKPKMGAIRLKIGSSEELDDAFFFDPTPLAKQLVAEEGRQLLEYLAPASKVAQPIKMFVFMASGDVIESTVRSSSTLFDAKKTLESITGLPTYVMLLFTGDDEEPVADDRELVSLSTSEIQFYLVVAAAERGVMGELFNSCGGSKWLSRENWLSESPLSDWQHLLFTQKDLGTALMTINLSHNGLRGTLPKAVTALAVLRTLNLSHNEIQGPIPPFCQEEESQGSCLEVVNLSHNYFTGPIPDLSHHPRLWSVSLQMNQLAGPHPASLQPVDVLNGHLTLDPQRYGPFCNENAHNEDHEIAARMACLEAEIAAKIAVEIEEAKREAHQEMRRLLNAALDCD